MKTIFLPSLRCGIHSLIHVNTIPRSTNLNKRQAQGNCSAFGCDDDSMLQIHAADSDDSILADPCTWKLSAIGDSMACGGKKCLVGTFVWSREILHAMVKSVLSNCWV